MGVYYQNFGWGVACYTAALTTYTSKVVSCFPLHATYRHVFIRPLVQTISSKM